MRRRGLALLPLLAALACGHSTRQRGGPALSPAATRDSVDDVTSACMDGVLAASQLADRYVIPRRAEHRRARYFVLRNPPNQRTTGMSVAILPDTGTPRRLVLEFGWPGPWQGTGGMKPPPRDQGMSNLEGEALTDMGTALLRELRAQCVPMAPGETACVRVEEGRAQRCTIGA